MSPTTYTQADRIDDVAVIGAGVMGHGIAIEFAEAGHRVALQDLDEDALEQSEEKVRWALRTLADAGRLPEEEIPEIESRIERTPSMAEAVDGVDFVTEAVAENLDIKKTVFEQLDQHTDDDVILATNTSGLSITEIGSAVEQPERVVGTHYFNPPYVVPLVEVIRGDRTADEVIDITYDLMDRIGKTPVVVEKDIPGFIGNRIQLAMMYEAFSLLDRGVASAEDIDKVVKSGFGFRLPLLGIFEKTDHSGLDVHLDVQRYLVKDLDRGIDTFDLTENLVENGDYGLKTGRGIYDWSDLDSEDVYERRDRGLLDILELYESREMYRSPYTGSEE
ncbi:MAG: 3-hydroxyacyl-CoA dehydrogenase NAD-binding domain-containing protein [Halapricum sp.]